MSSSKIPQMATPRGFTIVELLVVIAIIALLVSIPCLLLARLVIKPS